jgi:hypothetical protein
MSPAGQAFAPSWFDMATNSSGFHEWKANPSDPVLVCGHVVGLDGLRTALLDATEIVD